jgi:beta-glucosidase
LTSNQTHYAAGDKIKVSLNVKNTGNMQGKEVTLLFISHKDGEIFRPARELKGFEAVDLLPGEEKAVEMEISVYDLGYYNTAKNAWCVEPGEYELSAGGESLCIFVDGEKEVMSL